MSLATLPKVDTRQPAAVIVRSEKETKKSLATPANPASASKPSLDRPLHAAAARFTGGVSPLALSQAYTDWFQHLWFSPDKQIELIEKTAGLSYLVGACTGRSPPPD